MAVPVLVFGKNRALFLFSYQYRYRAVHLWPFYGTGTSTVLHWYGTFSCPELSDCVFHDRRVAGAEAPLQLHYYSNSQYYHC